MGVQMDAGAVTETTDPDCTVIPRMGSSWTEERVATVKRMVTENYTASQIAAELGGVSRNAVIGIIHRRKFSGVSAHAPGAPQVRNRGGRPANIGGGPAQAIKAKRRRLQVKGRHGAFGAGVVEVADPPMLEINGVADTEIPAAQRCALLDLTNTTCRWPVGDPQSPEFFFCGAPGADCESGRPYCALHSSRAYDRTANAVSSMRWAAARATYNNPRTI
jgi:GcrA cell cycle regulator